MKNGESIAAAENPAFPITRWSLVLRAVDGTDKGANSALAQLCQEYWYPLYAYVRRRGHSVHDAQDLTQSFMVELVDGPLVGRADPKRGRFRSFILGALQNFLANEQRHRRAERRGGGVSFITIDEASDEGRFALEPVDHVTPEDAFERNWAVALLDAVLTRVRHEYETAGRGKLFEAIRPYMEGKEGKAGYAGLGQELGLSENTVAVSVFRLRRRYGELLREEIASTVATDKEAEEEISHLLAILSR